jgi:DNA repair exonuclease SbcCD ATPase subunit
MRHKILAGGFFTAVLLLAGVISGRVVVRAAAMDQSDNQEVSKLLEDIKTQAADLQKDSDTLESFTRNSVSWESHAEELESIKERINAIGKTIKQLENLRGSASPWQQEAIDRILPVARKLASNTQAAINHLNKNPKMLQDPQYQEYLKSNAEAAQRLSALVSDFVEYGKTKSKLETLERTLEVPRSRSR